MAGTGRDLLAESAPGRVAPFAAIRSRTIAAGIDDEVLASKLVGNILAIGNEIRSSLEIGSIQSKPIGIRYSNVGQTAGYFIYSDPRGMAGIHIDTGTAFGFQGRNGELYKIISNPKIIRRQAIDK